MSAGRAERIEQLVDAGAAMILAAAAAYFTLRLSSGMAVVALAAAVGLCLGFGILRAIRPEERHFPMAAFDSPEIAPAEDDLVPPGGEQPSEPPSTGSPELLLDDPLAELASDSRVVRLFDPAAMPTPGELRDRIDRHLGSTRSPATGPQGLEVDASQALHEALAELRRSLH